MKKIVLGFFSHPDDAEFACAGTLSLLKKEGWKIHIATMTPGDKGSAKFRVKEISRIRKKEAAESAKLLDGTYHCLGFDDIYIFYDRETINETTALIRKIRPAIVFTASPNDYMADHEMTAKIVQTACFSAGIKNMEVDEELYEPVPYLYYSDPFEAKDIFGSVINPSVYIDITTEIAIKEKMLSCHKSQRDWLLAHHKIDEYILTMKSFAEKRGKEINKLYAEGFRQHLGHGFPQNNILKEALSNMVIIKDIGIL
ncbi:MAG: PIG-L family deacetylase [Bacteroidales bacterium]|nr:PIG-L family deacetylase [Bacteroidales bacterium]